MNRKDRRAQEKAAEKVKAKTPAAALMTKPQASGNAEYEKQVGMKLKAEGKETEAIPHLIKALELDSSFADVHFMLAMMARSPDSKVDMHSVNKAIKNRNTLKNSYKTTLDILNSRKQYKESLICQEEVCRLYPDDDFEKTNLALLMTLAGLTTNALEVLAELINENPNNKTYKSIFTHSCGPVSFKNESPLVKKALQICFDNIYETNLQKAYSPWISLILCDPQASALREGEKISSNEEFNDWANKQPKEKFAFLNDKFFLDGLRLLIISDPIMEGFLRHLRYWICTNASQLASTKELDLFEDFLCSMGEQSFFNEYLYDESSKEKEIIDELISMIDQKKLSNISEAQAYSLIACYRPLINVFPNHTETLVQLSKNSENFSRLVKTQILDPLEEKRLKLKLEKFGKFENEVSKTVQNQYEENPYPRWISVITFPTPNDGMPTIEADYKYKSMNILVAGCGTGRHAINTAAMFPNSMVTAIDLSQSSLGYAQRKANETVLSNRIRFIHADILSMRDWQGQFDIIESSGVLHHMEDPFKGWQVLTNLLKSGGYFKIGLYSESAREQIVEARKYVQDNGFPSTQEGIRACRTSIMNLPRTNIMRQKLIASMDFYATSVVRDLIFHVQEHRMTLPQIQGMMDKLGLVSTRFVISNAEHLVKFDEMFPEDRPRKSLDNWHKFEQKYPEAFAAMYQFWCQKT